MLKISSKPERVDESAGVDDQHQNTLFLQQFLDEFAECLADLCTLNTHVHQKSTEELLASTNWNELADHWVAVEDHLRSAIEAYHSQFASGQTARNFKSGKDS